MYKKAAVIVVFNSETTRESLNLTAEH
jgi:hypothetical protein